MIAFTHYIKIISAAGNQVMSSNAVLIAVMMMVMLLTMA